MRRIAIFSNVTTSVLSSFIGDYCRVWTPPGHGAWVQYALDVPKELIDFSPDVIYVLLDTRFSPRESFEERALDSLRRQFGEEKVVVPQIEKIAMDLGDRFYDERMWKLALMPWSLEGLKEIARVIMEIKVIALDLDETLWAGVVSEDGVESIKPKIDFINELKSLKERGVVLTIISRNEKSIVEQAFLRDDVALKLTDFAKVKIGWGDKTLAIKELSQELNMTLKDFLFIDDNPVERIMMRSACPDVIVSEFPPELSVRFPPKATTKEDAIRIESYKADIKRKELAEKLPISDYYKSLNMSAEVREATIEDLSRLSQLSQRSNQFNVCSNRYSVDDLSKFYSLPNFILLCASVKDRFSSLGNVAFAVIECSNDNARLIDFAISCRSMNRTFEYAFIEKIFEFLKERKIEQLDAIWKKSGRNEPSRFFFDEAGFELISFTEEERKYTTLIKNRRSIKTHYFTFTSMEEV